MNGEGLRSGATACDPTKGMNRGGGFWGGNGNGGPPPSFVKWTKLLCAPVAGSTPPPVLIETTFHPFATIGESSSWPKTDVPSVVRLKTAKQLCSVQCTSREGNVLPGRFDRYSKRSDSMSSGHVLGC